MFQLFKRKRGEEGGRKAQRIRYPAKRGYRADLGIELKSSMEANYMRFLRFKGVKSSYEPERFTFPHKNNPYGITSHVPDFKAEAGKFYWFVEVKGFVDDLSREKARLMKLYYPWIRMIYVTEREYKLIEKFYRKDIPNWE